MHKEPPFLGKPTNKLRAILDWTRVTNKLMSGVVLCPVYACPEHAEKSINKVSWDDAIKH